MKQELGQAIAAACNKLFNISNVQVVLTRPDEKFGDYATNIALQLAGQAKQKPRDIAEALAGILRESLANMVAEVVVAEPGFLNIRLRDETLLAPQPTSVRGAVWAGKSVTVETNNPNPFKDLHIGHAFNSIVADTIANLLDTGGAETHRVSYHGNVGLHVGKSMWAILQYIAGDMNRLKQIPVPERPKFLSEKYAEGAAAYEKDAAAKQEIEQLAMESFHPVDLLFKQVYECCKEWSFAYFDEMFEKIGSKPVERRYLESEADAEGRAVVETHIADGIFERSDGAVIFSGERYGLHTRVFISSRGTTLYETRDLGLMQLKQREFAPLASYIITANEQKEYFRVVCKAAELALPELSGVTHNISTGTVKLSTGKMSSRAGTAINIGWLFRETAKALRQRGTAQESLRDSLIGALRYTMLKNRLDGDTIFDISEAISLEGNSGPYLQYAHARARSILRKAEGMATNSVPFEAAERSLARKVSEYTEVVERAVQELMPHYVCTYLYELAQNFNRFYEHNRVIGSDRQAVRLQLVRAYADTLQAGLGLLGITAPDTM